jgi:putative SOS response-associated peptidase YedK
VCGRFNVLQTPGLEALLADLGCPPLASATQINVAPTEQVALARRDADTGTRLDDARWWLTPAWAKDLSQKYAMFNARSEGLTRSPAFRKPFAQQRGLIPMSSFVEWRGASGNKQPWLITSPYEALAVAALWDVWRGDESAAPLLSCTIVTTEAAEAFQPWHKRMPVMLTDLEWDRWLDNTQTIDASDPIFAPVLKHPLRLVPINRSVGNSRNKDASALDAVGEVVELPADDG